MSRDRTDYEFSSEAESVEYIEFPKSKTEGKLSDAQLALVFLSENSNYHDYVIRASCTFEGDFDLERMNNVLEFMFDRNIVLRSGAFTVDEEEEFFFFFLVSHIEVVLEEKFEFDRLTAEVFFVLV